MIRSSKKKTSCPVCLMDNSKVLHEADIDLKRISFSYEKHPDFNKTFRVLRCLSCSHVFCSPLPDNIDSLYEDVIDDEYLRYEDARRKTGIELLKTLKKYKKSGKLLDVGCATG